MIKTIYTCDLCKQTIAPGQKVYDFDVAEFELTKDGTPPQPPSRLQMLAMAQMPGNSAAQDEPKHPREGHLMLCSACMTRPVTLKASVHWDECACYPHDPKAHLTTVQE